MAEHKVQIRQFPEAQILNKDLVVEVYSDDEKLGDLTVSRGGLGWIPAGPSLERHFGWEQFDRYVREWKG
jgi:hypothetical protein